MEEEGAIDTRWAGTAVEICEDLRHSQVEECRILVEENHIPAAEAEEQVEVVS